MTRATTGMSSATAVATSWQVIRKEPSPQTATTVRPGLPTLAPMAAGRPKPMVPSPPELMKERSESTGK
jgi:hypothetical protein